MKRDGAGCGTIIAISVVLLVFGPIILEIVEFILLLLVMAFVSIYGSILHLFGLG